MNLGLVDTAAKCFGFGDMAYNISQKIGLSSLIPVDIDPTALKVAANTTGILAIGMSPKNISKKEVFNHATKITQLMTFGLRSADDQSIADSFERASVLLGMIGTAMTLYTYVWTPAKEMMKEINATCSIAVGI